MKFLPSLDPALQPPAPNAGSEWGEHGAGLGVLAKYSGALVVSHADVPAERLKSVPSPWARLLLFEQALFSDRHPAHPGIRSEWRGIMGAIGLARYLGIEVSPRLVDLGQAGGVLRSLRQLAPSNDQPELWNQLALLFLDGELVGGTSPRTLVFAGIRPISRLRVPFQRNGRLSDPTLYYRELGDRTSLALLHAWIKATIASFSAGGSEMTRLLGHVPSGDGADPILRLERLMRTMQDWEIDTHAAVAEVGSPAGRVLKEMTQSGLDVVFPEQHPAAYAFRRFHQVVPADGLEQSNELQVAGEDVVVDPGAAGVLMRDGHRFSGDVLLPRGMSRTVRNGRFTLATAGAEVGASLPDLGTFFEEKLIPVRDLDSASGIALEVSGVHYILPFKGTILTHLSVENLVRWTTATGERATGISVRLAIPLQGGLQLTHEHRFSGGDVFDAEQVLTPRIAVWPDFESTQWAHYYWFQQEPARGALRFEPWNGVEAGTHPEPIDGLRWGHLTSPIRAWLGSFQRFQGILPVRPATLVRSTQPDWHVSIDFGSTHSRAYRSTIGAGGAATLRAIPLTPRARPLLGGAGLLPYNFFVTRSQIKGSAEEPASLVWLPLGQTRETAQVNDWLPSNGVIFWEALETAPNTDGLRGNLKWHRDDSHERAAFHSYATQLFLSIAAEAAAEGAKVRSVITAYPSVLPNQLRHRHRMEWEQVGRQFDVEVKRPRSESDALASYLTAQHGATIATNLLAIDIGGSTSDLSVWLRGRRAHGDSIRLAGDVLSRLVNGDQAARDAITVALQRPPFNAPVRWDENDPTKNGMIFNSVLRTIARNPQYASEPDLLARNLFDGQGSPGERVLAHLAYLFATVSFVMGLMVRRERPRADRYDLRFAGKGSEFLHWLEALNTGASKSLPATFFLGGLGETGDDIEVVAVPPPDGTAKQEVGQGLLHHPIEDDSDIDDRVTFLGEVGFHMEGSPLSWDSKLDFDVLRRMSNPPEPTPIEDLASLNSFVKLFDQDPAAKKAARALGIVPTVLGRELRNKIHDRLFGPQSTWSALRNTRADATGDALLEPFFVTEAKVLLEHATDSHGLFR